MPWKAYNSRNGETWPALGDVDGEGRDEVVLGAGDGGYAAVLDGGSHRLVRWVHLPWEAYNVFDGEVRPALGDADDDGRDELVLGTGAFPQRGGWLGYFEDGTQATQFRGWVRVHWGAYGLQNGETWPAFLGQARAE